MDSASSPENARLSAERLARERDRLRLLLEANDAVISAQTVGHRWASWEEQLREICESWAVCFGTIDFLPNGLLAVSLHCRLATFCTASSTVPTDVTSLDTAFLAALFRGRLRFCFLRCRHRRL
jgi:hypothetical protein